MQGQKDRLSQRLEAHQEHQGQDKDTTKAHIVKNVQNKCLSLSAKEGTN